MPFVVRIIESSEQLQQLVAAELDSFEIVDKNFLSPYLVSPSLHLLHWSYSLEPVSYPGWLVADFRKKDVGIFFSQYGHDKHDPWGAIHISDKQFGMDDHWFLSLEDAVINSGCWIGELPHDYEIK
jgi:hypothetical protein